MSCCACCCCGGAGIAVPVVPLLEICGAVWVVEHLLEVLIVCAVCGLLAVVASILLFRWADRRDGARMAAWRQRHAAIGGPVTVLRAEVLPPESEPVAAPVRGALGPPPKSWLCETCYWAWPLDLPFCGVCGHNRGVTGAQREVVIRQALPGEAGKNVPR